MKWAGVPRGAPRPPQTAPSPDAQAGAPRRAPSSALGAKAQAVPVPMVAAGRLEEGMECGSGGGEYNGWERGEITDQGGQCRGGTAGDSRQWASGGWGWSMVDGAARAPADGGGSDTRWGEGMVGRGLKSERRRRGRRKIRCEEGMGRVDHLARCRRVRGGDGRAKCGAADWQPPARRRRFGRPRPRGGGAAGGHPRGGHRWEDGRRGGGAEQLHRRWSTDKPSMPTVEASSLQVLTTSDFSSAFSLYKILPDVNGLVNNMKTPGMHTSSLCIRSDIILSLSEYVTNSWVSLYIHGLWRNR